MKTKLYVFFLLVTGIIFLITGCFNPSIPAPEEIDVVAPYIVSTNLPADLVVRDCLSVFEVEFSEAMNHAAVESALDMYDAWGNKVIGVFSWSDNTLTFTPDDQLRNSGALKYSITISTSALDLAGNGIETEYVVEFQTSDFTIPSTMAYYPGPGSSAPGNYTAAKVTFSREMEPSSCEANIRFRNMTTSSWVSGTFSWNTGFTEVSFVPDLPWGDGNIIIVESGTGCYGVNGKHISVKSSSLFFGPSS